AALHRSDRDSTGADQPVPPPRHRDADRGDDPAAARADQRREPRFGRPSGAVRLAFVVQRYGVEVAGGSELHCRWHAERLARTHSVEIFTTQALGYVEWE